MPLGQAVHLNYQECWLAGITVESKITFRKMPRGTGSAAQSCSGSVDSQHPEVSTAANILVINV